MSISSTKIGDLSISRLIIGGNPFSGGSHQSIARNIEMKNYHTPEKIMETLRKAEELGITTLIARCDKRIISILKEYWRTGGSITWIAQTCFELPDFDQMINDALNAGAKAVFIHGGVMDSLYAERKHNTVSEWIDKIKRLGVPAGIAGHNPDVFRWAEEYFCADFYMCCYYNPDDRSSRPGYDPNVKETFCDDDRDIMAKLIQDLSRPAIHYKIMAAGRKSPEDAFSFAGMHLRSQDAICIGIYTGDKTDMIEEDIRLFKKYADISI